MRWSLKSLMLYMAAFAACLTLCYLPFAEAGGLVLFVAILILSKFVPGKLWRYLTYGALVGAIGAFVAASIYAQMASGATGPRTYLTISAVDSYFKPLRPFLFPMGSFFGGSIGLLLYNRNQKPT